MRRLKKSIFLGFSATSLVVLGIVRQCNPGVMQNEQPVTELADSSVVSPSPVVLEQPAVVEQPSAGPRYHKIRGVHSYAKCFPDLQEVQIVAAQKWGVSPVRDRAEAEQRKDELVYIGAYPFYAIDNRMTSSIPYLVPRASVLLQDISRNFLDSLAIKGVPLHKVIVTSVLRTEADIAKLMRTNVNASSQSCHRYGTTFDICYNRYETVCPPGEVRREVRNDTLKWVLSEVLRDLRQQERCYIKYERKQGCFHITVR